MRLKREEISSASINARNLATHKWFILNQFEWSTMSEVPKCHSRKECSNEGSKVIKNLSIFKLGSWSWSVVKVKFKIHSQKRTRADFIIQMHLSPPTQPTTFKQQYKGQKTRKRTRSIAMLALNQQLTITHNPPPSR